MQFVEGSILQASTTPLTRNRGRRRVRERTPTSVWLVPESVSPPRRPSQRKSTVSGLNRFPPRLINSRGPCHLNPQPVLPARGSCAFQAFLRGALLIAPLSARKYATAFFLIRKQRTPKKPDTSSHCSSVQERLVIYGSEALDSVEHLGLILGSQKQADALLKHFGSLTGSAKKSGVKPPCALAPSFVVVT
jgi:hypothetical protein